MDTPGGWGLFAGWLLKSSAQAALLVVLVLAVQWLLRRWLTPRWRYFLWWLVVARLLMPVSLPGPVSIFNWVKWNSPPAPAMAVTPDTPDVALPASPPDTGVTAFEETTPALPAESPVTIAVPAPTAPTRPPFDWRRAVMWLWLAGAALLGARLVWSVLRLRRELRTATPVDDPTVLALLDECREQMRVRDRLTLLETPLVNSPALCGFWRPKLLLPPGLCRDFTAQQLRFIFLHELAHVRRHDIAVNWLITLLQLLHWFNPLVWLAFSRLRADRELACDALALSLAAPGEQHAYGQTIIRLLEGFARPSAMPGLVGILEDKNQMKRRIRMIAQFRRPGRWAWLSGIAAAILGIACLTDAQTPKGKEEANPNPAAASTNSATASHPQEIRVTANVVDAATGAPIDSFSVIPGQRYPGQNEITWAWFAGFAGKEGTADQVVKAPQFLGPSVYLMVEAKGCAPFVSEALRLADRIDFKCKLSKGKPIAGVVLLPNGEPAKWAEVRLWRNEADVGYVPSERNITASKNGEFSLEDAAFTRMLVSHPSGSAELTAEQARASSRITLRPDGKLIGVLRLGDKLASNRSVHLSRLCYGYTPNLPTRIYFPDIRTDADGRFTIDQVPEGEYWLGLQRKFRVNFDPVGFTEFSATSHALPVQIRSGGTTTVNLGGTGRTIEGQIIADPQQTVDWTNAIGYLTLQLPEGSLPPRDAAGAIKTDLYEFLLFRDKPSPISASESSEAIAYSLSEEGKRNSGRSADILQKSATADYFGSRTSRKGDTD